MLSLKMPSERYCLHFLSCKILWKFQEKELEDHKIEYAVQLVQTNKCQADFYECHLPEAVDNIQKVYEGQMLYFASVMSRQELSTNQRLNFRNGPLSFVTDALRVRLAEFQSYQNAILIWEQF